MITLNAYAYNATEQQRKSMKGQGIPLDFIKALETGEIDLTRALENVKSHVAYDNRNGFHTADIHCALAAVHFVKARKDGASEEMLEELRADFFKEMTLYFDSVDFLEKTDLEKHLYRIVSTKIVPWENKKMTIFYENLNEALANARKEYLKNCDYYEPPKSFHVKHLVQVANNRAVNRKWAVFFSNTDTILNDFRTFLLNTLNQTEKGDIAFLEANVLHAWQDGWNEWEDEDGYYHNQWELPAEKKNYVDL